MAVNWCAHLYRDHWVEWISLRKRVQATCCLWINLVYFRYIQMSVIQIEIRPNRTCSNHLCICANNIIGRWFIQCSKSSYIWFINWNFTQQQQISISIQMAKDREQDTRTMNQIEITGTKIELYIAHTVLLHSHSHVVWYIYKKLYAQYKLKQTGRRH